MVGNVEDCNYAMLPNLTPNHPPHVPRNAGQKQRRQDLGLELAESHTDAYGLGTQLTLDGPELCPGFRGSVAGGSTDVPAE